MICGDGIINSPSASSSKRATPMPLVRMREAISVLLTFCAFHFFVQFATQ